MRRFSPDFSSQLAILLWLLSLIVMLAACSNSQQPSATAVTLVTPAASETQAAESSRAAYPGPASATPAIALPDGEMGGTSSPYPAPVSTTARAVVEVEPSATEQAYLPFVDGEDPSQEASSRPSPSPSPTPLPSHTATISPSPTVTPVPTVDFAAARAEIEASGQEIGFVKIGFHVTFLDEKGILDEWMRQQDAAGVPFFLKTVDNAEPLYKAQELRRASGVPHTLVFRASGGVPNYDLPPDVAAREHWTMHRDLFPPELDPNLVWVETVNELDKNRSEWIAEFALETARLALADGFRWAAFGWAIGEPELTDWESPKMLEFLRLVGENPDRLAIALHEGSGTVDDVKFDYPYRTGRFLKLFEIADKHGIPRPTVLISEFSWAYDDIPAPAKAMEDLRWLAALYAPFPQVKGAAIWNLGSGCCFGEVAAEVEQLIDPLLHFALTTYYRVPSAPERAPLNPELYR